ncbi:MAG TPA: Ku protein [Casimicrobiaceae bacterium]|jgi:DNA end-binding protein Ku|nr:Ku protein [Casimicrobiaceae bacterium]
MAPRPNWKGYLKLSLVSCPIALYPATSAAERVSFRQLNRQTGNRLRQQLVDSVTGEPVNSENKGRGYEIGKDQFLMVEDEELDAIQVESTHTIEIDSFVPRDQIDERYLDSPYFIAPTDKIGQEAFAVIREAMRDKKMVGIGRVVIARRERVIMLESFGKGILGTTLRYPYEVREAEGYFEDVPDIKLSDEIRELATHILETKRADFDPAKFEDRYETALVEMLKSKQVGMPMKAEAPAPQPANVVNLLDALRRSIAAEKPPPAPSVSERRKPPAPAKTGRRPQGRTSKRA